MRRASVVIVVACASCATGGAWRTGSAALGWSLGGEAHVFIANDRYARNFYRRLTGSGHLADSLGKRPLVAVEVRRNIVTVLSANGATPARVTLARFHAPRTCSHDGIVTELVLAFPPGGAAGSSAPPPHLPVVAMLNEPTFAGGPGTLRPALSRPSALELVNRVVERAERGSSATLLRPLVLDRDQWSDAGEVVSLGWGYAVGFRARFVATGGDTVLVTGVADTDLELRELRWVIGPRRIRLIDGMIPRTSSGVRYSVRGIVAGAGTLLLVNEIADVSPRASRATVLDPASRKVVASQPLALRCR